MKPLSVYETPVPARRIAIDRIEPDVDAGRFAVKRIIHRPIHHTVQTSCVMVTMSYPALSTFGPPTQHRGQYCHWSQWVMTGGNQNSYPINSASGSSLSVDVWIISRLGVEISCAETIMAKTFKENLQKAVA